MTYRAPVKDMLFCMKELAGHRRRGATARIRGRRPDTAQAVLEECAKFNEGVVAPLNTDGDVKPSSCEGRRGHDHRRLQAGLPAVCRGRLAGRAAPGRVRRPGPAQDHRRGLHRDAQQRQPELRAVPAALRRRHRGLDDGGHARAAVDLHPEDGRRQLDRHDEPDRAAGRQRPGRGAHARRAAARRQLQALRHQDLHHLR